MKRKYIFRLDDISWDMNIEKFERIKELFILFSIRPIIGVIPDNHDEKLKKYIGEKRLSEEDFWRMIEELQSKYGWMIALHGENHVYVNKLSGMFKRNNQSEFAGLPLEEQKRKIERGKAILESHGIVPEMFMAPAHSLDQDTVEALKANGIFAITDGNTPFPYFESEMFFIPQVWSWPRFLPFGIQTICIHTNTCDDRMMKRIENLIKELKDKTIIPKELLNNKEQYKRKYYGVINSIGTGFISFENNLISLLYQLVAKVRSRRTK